MSNREAEQQRVLKLIDKWDAIASYSKDVPTLQEALQRDILPLLRTLADLLAQPTPEEWKGLVARIEWDDANTYHDDGWWLLTKGEGKSLLRAITTLQAEHARLKGENEKLGRLKVHCERCGAAYAATGIEAGCPCLLHAALVGLLASPYGCSLCDSGKTRNAAKGHQPDCPYAIARKVLGRSLPEDAV